MTSTFSLLFLTCVTLFKTSLTKNILNLTGREAAELVREEFIYAYDAYEKYALGSDDLLPLTKNGYNWTNYSMLITPIDSLDTMYLMNLTKYINNTLKLLCNPSHNFNFNQNIIINVFETIIRVLGGLLSSYYFLKNECLKNLAIDLGERIYNASFLTKSNLKYLPYNNINLKYLNISNINNSIFDTASLGTNMLEFGLLSYITNNSKYYLMTKKTMKQLFNISSNYNLIGQEININPKNIYNKTEIFINPNSHIASAIDSYWEYQIKCWQLFNDYECKDMWLKSNYSIMKYMKYYDNTNPNRLWFKRVNMFNITYGNEEYWYDLHAQFFSSSLTLTKNKYDLNIAINNQEANHYMWNLTKINIFGYNFNTSVLGWPTYQLNPELYESNYYLYCITNNSLYFNRALLYLENLIKYTHCNNTEICVGYSALNNAVTKERMNECPSYFFSETLKYLYLTFMKNEIDNPLNFNDFIFNTEVCIKNIYNLYIII